MTLKRLAHTLSESLAHCAWDDRGITACLNRRLPPALWRFITLLTDELLHKSPQPIAPSRTRIAAVLVNSLIFERIHSYCVKHKTWPGPDFQPAKMQPLLAFAHLDIPQLETLTALSDWLMLTPEQLDYYSDPTGRHEEHGDMAVNHYHYHRRPKKSGGQRLIEAPKPRLKSLQNVILNAILYQIPAHPNAYGFIQGRSCIAGAARHVGEDIVLGFDLRNFFQSIQAKRVHGIFRALGYPPNVASALIGLCTVTTPARVRNQMPYAQRQALRIAHLPQGAPTSPTLANLAAYRLDCRLTGLAQSLGATYTRYADDLTFSGDRYIKDALLNAVPTIVADAGFALNPAKTRAMPSTTRQVVTGIVVNAKTNVDRRDYDRLKATIHAGLWQNDPAVLATLEGQIGWVAQLNPAKGARLRELLAGQGADA